MIGGIPRDMVWLEFDRSDWPGMKAYLEQKAADAQTLMRRLRSPS